MVNGSGGNGLFQKLCRVLEVNAEKSGLFWHTIESPTPVWIGPKSVFDSITEFLAYLLEYMGKKTYTFISEPKEKLAGQDALIIRFNLRGNKIDVLLKRNQKETKIELDLFKYNGVPSIMISILPLLSKHGKNGVSDLVKKTISAIEKQIDSIKNITSNLINFGRNFCLGRSLGYALGVEFCRLLGIQLGIHAESYPAGESKHGPIALIEDNFPVFHFLHNREAKEKMISSIMEMKARGARIYVISHIADAEIREVADTVIWLPKELDWSNYMSYIGYLVPALTMTIDRQSDLIGKKI